MDAQELRNLQEAYIKVYTNINEADRFTSAETIQKQVYPHLHTSPKVNDRVLAQQGGKPGTVQVKKERKGGFLGIGSKEVNVPVPGTFTQQDVSSVDAARYNNEVDNRFKGHSGSTDDTTAYAVQKAAQRKGHSGYMRVKDPSSVPNTGLPNRANPWRADDQNQAIRNVGNKFKKEEVDIFDVILEHLVAEGFADTEEAALAIMTNMSEEWRQSIVEEEGVKAYAVDGHGNTYRDYANDGLSARQRRMKDFAIRRAAGLPVKGV